MPMQRHKLVTWGKPSSLLKLSSSPWLSVLVNSNLDFESNSWKVQGWLWMYFCHQEISIRLSVTLFFFVWSWVKSQLFLHLATLVLWSKSILPVMFVIFRDVCHTTVTEECFHKILTSFGIFWQFSCPVNCFIWPNRIPKVLRWSYMSDAFPSRTPSPSPPLFIPFLPPPTCTIWCHFVRSDQTKLMKKKLSKRCHKDNESYSETP